MLIDCQCTEKVLTVVPHYTLHSRWISENGKNKSDRKIIHILYRCVSLLGLHRILKIRMYKIWNNLEQFGANYELKNKS